MTTSSMVLIGFRRQVNPRLFSHNLGSTGSLSKANTPKTHS